MDFNILEQLDIIWGKAKELGILKHIVSIRDLLMHPRKFWKEYEKLSAKDKTVQFITYGAILALFIGIASDVDFSVGEILKIIIMEIAAMFVYVVVVYLANSIVKKQWNEVWFFVVLCCYIKFLGIIPQIVVLGVYYVQETPLLMAVFFIIPLVVELLLVMYAAYVRQEGRKSVIWAILLSVVFLNVYDGLFIVTGWPSAINSNYENKIAKERFDLGRAIKNTYDIPYCVASNGEGREVWYLYSNPMDSIARVKFDDPEKYIAIVKADMDSLRAIGDRCRFKTNKAFFNELYSLKRDIVYVHDTKMYRKSRVIKQTVVMYDSEIVDRIVYHEFSHELTERNERLLREDIEQVEQFESARAVSYLGALWHPVLFGYSMGVKWDGRSRKKT